MNANKSVCLELLQLIQKESQTCALWLVSAVAKILEGDPETTVQYLWEIVEKAMPESVQEYRRLGPNANISSV
jgi:hypothetical protein